MAWWRLASSGARKIDDGCTVAVTSGASGDSTNSPRCSVSRNCLPRRAWAAVAPSATRTRGFTTSISASSHGRHARISSAPGRLWMRRFPRGVHLKCFPAFVTWTFRRSMPASSRARSRSLPAGPTNGAPSTSSRSPGCSPTSMTSAVRAPSPNTVWVALRYRSQPRHSAAAFRSSGRLSRGGRNSAAERFSPPAAERFVSVWRAIALANVPTPEGLGPRLDTPWGGGVPSPSRLEHAFDSRQWIGEMSKRYDEEVRVEQDGGLPASFVWRGRRYEVADVIGRWRIEGRWWEDGRDREYWRVEARGGAVWDLYHDRRADHWHLERLWD